MDIIPSIIKGVMSLGFNAPDILVMFPLLLIILYIFTYYYCSLLDNKVDFYYYTISETFIPVSSPLQLLTCLRTVRKASK